MASTYAALACTEDDSHHLYLGLGAGTLPMLMDSKSATAIELDSDVVEMATEYCGLDTARVKVIVGDAWDHSMHVEDQPLHSAIFVDIFGADNNVPKVFCEDPFVENMFDALPENGILIANFHRGNDAENERLREGQATYARVFGRCLSPSSRFQGNVILAAVKNKVPKLEINRAQRVAREKQWPLNPASRLQKVKTIRS